MVSSDHKEARRPEIQLYRPGQGLPGRSLKSKVVTKEEKKSNLESTSNRPVNYSECTKNRKPDIQVYVPKGRLYASRINNESSHKEDFSKQKENDGKLLKKLDSGCSYRTTHNEVDKVCLPKALNSSRLQTKSWADQVEEHLSAVARFEEDSYSDSSSENNLEQKENSSVCVDHQGKSLDEPKPSASENEGILKQKTGNHTDPLCDTQSRKLQHPLTGEFVQSGSEMYDKLKSIDEIVDQQIAMFNSMIRNGACKKTLFQNLLTSKDPVMLKHKSREGSTNILENERINGLKNDDKDTQLKSVKDRYDKNHVNASVPVSSIYPVRNLDDDYLKMLEKRDRIIDQQIAMFDKMVINIKSVKPKVRVTSVASVREKPVQPKAIVSSQVLPVRKELVKPELDNPPTPEVFISPPVPLFREPCASNTDEMERVFSPLMPIPCTKIDHRLCTSGCQDSYYSNLLVASDFIPPPKPLVKKVHLRRTLESLALG